MTEFLVFIAVKNGGIVASSTEEERALSLTLTIRRISLFPKLLEPMITSNTLTSIA